MKLSGALPYSSAPWSVKSHAAETYYGGLCMPSAVARTQEEAPMAATTLSTTPGYGQYASAADTGYGAAVGSPTHNHQHPLHFGEEIST